MNLKEHIKQQRKASIKTVDINGFGVKLARPGKTRTAKLVQEAWAKADEAVKGKIYEDNTPDEKRLNAVKDNLEELKLDLPTTEKELERIEVFIKHFGEWYLVEHMVDEEGEPLHLSDDPLRQISRDVLLEYAVENNLSDHIRSIFSEEDEKKTPDSLENLEIVPPSPDTSEQASLHLDF